ncbi:hypothetical protein MASR1M59_07250 [Melaminivora sp.]
MPVLALGGVRRGVPRGWSVVVKMAAPVAAKARAPVGVRQWWPVLRLPGVAGSGAGGLHLGRGWGGRAVRT